MWFECGLSSLNSSSVCVAEFEVRFDTCTWTWRGVSVGLGV